MNLLFYKKGELSDFLAGRHGELIKEIERLPSNYILNASEQDLLNHLVEKYTLQAPILKVEERYILSQQEVDIDVSQDRLRGGYGRRGPIYIKGTKITIAIPFEGDKVLFDYIPSTRDLNPPSGDVRENELVFSFEQTEHNAESIKNALERTTRSINEYLRFVAIDVSNYNQGLRHQIGTKVTTRKRKLLADLELVNSLGIPLKKRDDAVTTYSPPTIRRKPSYEKPVVKDSAFKPEPTLNMEEYEHILKVITNMVMVMERSPIAFAKMGEESLRQHFLVQLNGHYEGQATGETFNFEGKTDILVRSEGQNVFIAECKFWKGEKKLQETVDQLLGYLSWRDTKAALLVFNRNKSFSDILGKIPNAIESHVSFKRKLQIPGETAFRYVFGQPNDPNREVILTVLAFDVPN